MRKSIYFLLNLLILSLACEEVDFGNICGSTDPATELNWLKTLIEDRGDSFQNEISYQSFIFEGRIYIQDLYCGNAFILWSSTYYNCEGREKTFTSEDLEKINLLEKELIWKGTACD